MPTLFGVTIPEIDRRTKGRGASFSLSFELVNIEEWKKFENLEKEFTEKYKILYKDLVAEIHKYLIRLTPLHTGELRGGWTAFLEKYRYSYASQLFEHSLYDSFKTSNLSEEHRTYQIDPDAVEKGKQQSTLEDGLPGVTDVTVENQVTHGEPMEFGTGKVQARHTTERALYRGEQWFTEHFNRWFKMINDNGGIVDPPEVGEIQ